MTTKPPSRSADQFVLRLPEGMRQRIADEAKLNGRSMNAELVSRLQASFELVQPSALPMIQVALDTGDQPISWNEILDTIAAIRERVELDVVQMQVNVNTPELASSRTRIQEAAELAVKLRTKSAPRKASKKTPE